jgi:geranylgeranyl reductase family protein
MVMPIIEDLDERTSAEILVIGAGPAGSAAAIALARRGFDVLLVDRSIFPRHKVCGDALIPDALRALASLDLGRSLQDKARSLDGVAVHAPNGTAVVLQGNCAVIPRYEFDERLRVGAVGAGARFLAPYRAISPLIDGSRYSGARLQHGRSGETLEVMARWTVLATGAESDILRRFGVLRRREPSAIAARCYARVPPEFGATLSTLVISFDRRIAPGYGWVFPGPDHIVNLGVGLFSDVSRRRRAPGNLRTTMTEFLNGFPLARQVRDAAISVTRIAGAPLRTALEGSDLAMPGLFVVGEAAGATYSFSGEGIGKAMETGLLAATAIAAATERGRSLEASAFEYRHHVNALLRHRFRAYETTLRYLSHPAVSNFVAWRANASAFVRSQLEGVFNETLDPDELFSLRGLIGALVRR